MWRHVQPLIRKFVIKARADANETTANVVFAGANDTDSVCRSGNLPNGNANTCVAVTDVGTAGYRIGGGAAVGVPPTAPSGPLSVTGLPQSVTVTYGILVW